MAILSLTEKTTAVVTYLDDTDIYRVILDASTPGTGSLITYNKPSEALGQQSTILVTDTPAAVFNQSQKLFAATVGGLTTYLNADNVASIVTDGSTGSKIIYNELGSVSTLFATEAPLVLTKEIQGLKTKVTQPSSYTVAINTTPTLTAAQMALGLFLPTGTNGTATTPTATALVAALGAGIGSSFLWTVDATGMTGGNTATIGLDASITNQGAMTGYNDLTVAQAEVGVFKIYFNSLTTALIRRVE